MQNTFWHIYEHDVSKNQKLLLLRPYLERSLQSIHIFYPQSSQVDLLETKNVNLFLSSGTKAIPIPPLSSPIALTM